MACALHEGKTAEGKLGFFHNLASKDPRLEGLNMTESF